MIIDTLDNISKYASLNPLMTTVIDFLGTLDFNALEVSQTQVCGNDLRVNVEQIAPKTADNTLVEAHHDFLDIHIPLSGTETFGYTPASGCQQVVRPYQQDNDIVFFAAPAQSYVSLAPGMFAIVFPHEGHAPAINSQGLKKIIVKMKA